MRIFFFKAQHTQGFTDTFFLHSQFYLWLFFPSSLLNHNTFASPNCPWSRQRTQEIYLAGEPSEIKVQRCNARVRRAAIDLVKGYPFTLSPLLVWVPFFLKQTQKMRTFSNSVLLNGYWRTGSSFLTDAPLYRVHSMKHLPSQYGKVINATSMNFVFWGFGPKKFIL